jgi:site-specific DNA recombinase
MLKEWIKIKYAIYARQSVDRADSISIESQIEFCKHELRSEPFEIYQDKGYSGKNTERPEFQMLVKDIKDGKINVVIVYKLDRISRSILDFSNMINIFQQYNVDFISCTEKFDTSTPMGRAMLNICIVFAQLERETIQMRVSDAYESRSEKGYYMGGRMPYGFKKEETKMGNINTSKYIPIDEEVNQIKTIYEMYSNPLTTLGDILRYLNENDITKKRGKDWQTGRISEIIKNPIYVKADNNLYNFYKYRGTEIITPEEDFIGENGCYIYSKDNKSNSKDMSKYKEMKLVLAPHQGIIDSATWITCINKLDLNKQVFNGKSSMHTWLSGKLKCGKCGYALRFNRWKGKTKVNEYFLCSDHQNTGNCEGFGVIKQELLEDSVYHKMIEKIKDYKLLYDLKKDIKLEQEIQSTNNFVKQKENEISNLIDKLFTANESTTKYVNQRVELLDKELTVLKKQLFQLELQIENKALVNIKSIEAYLDNWKSLSLEDKQKFSNLLIDRVLVTKDEIIIDWKI